MRLVIVYLALIISMEASIIDGLYLMRAKYYISHHRYNRAIEEYLKIKDIDDEIKINIAYCLYRESRYSQAFEILQSITEPKLNSIRYYNMGNIAVKEGRLAEALKLYRGALKFGDDEDTKRNIEIVMRKIEMLKAVEKKRATLKPIRKGEDDPDRIFDSGLKDINLSESTKSLWNSSGNIATKGSSYRAEELDNILKRVGREPGSAEGGAKSTVSFRYWDKKMEQKSLNTLLIPIDEGDL